MMLEYRPAIPGDAIECIRLRGLTRENAVSEQRLAQIGITPQTWAADIRSGDLPGYICVDDEQMVGYCFGAAKTGEVVALAVLPSHENRGIARHLLGLVCGALRQLGHTRLFLGCSPDPSVRSYGLYRYLGWRSTGEFDPRGDEVLELYQPVPACVP
jgi:GNAT superfamily N-acetyltransferase